MAEDKLGLLGTTIADKYAVEAVVGEGGFATVYRAIHLVWKRPVAVKVFSALGEVAPAQRQKLLDDFIQEGALLAELSERVAAICQSRDVGMLTLAGGDQVPYMVLEWLEGTTLHDVLLQEQEQGLPVRTLEQTLSLLGPIAEALDVAHKKGIVHRDVKPPNIFVLGDPRGADVTVKLLDFGIAKVVQDAQKMGFGKTAGHLTSFTPMYGAPEQFNRAYGATGPWTDVFALALIVVEVVTGQAPIEGDSLVQLAYASSDPERRPTPRNLGLDVSDAVEEVFLRALAVKPEDRFPSAGELWSALSQAVKRSPAREERESVRIVPARSSTAEALASTALMDGTPRSPTPEAASSDDPSPTEPKVETRVGAEVAQGRSRTILVAALALAIGAATLVAIRSKNGAMTPDPVASSSAPSSSMRVKRTAQPSALRTEDAAACPSGMKLIPGGTFYMGSDDKDAEPREKPPHSVSLGPYCLDELEVTVARYKACSDKGSCLRASKENQWAGITELESKIYDPLCNMNDPKGRATHPINCLSWEQASKFCALIGGRLPTEAEWEFAARASDGRVYPWGDEPPNATLLNACGKECVTWMKSHPDPNQPAIAMYDDDDGFPATAPVGSFPKGKSEWGIHDLVGNVWEWVADYYGDYDPASAGTTTMNPQGPMSGADRVIRGGAWNASSPTWVRPAWRHRANPNVHSHGIGFRCAKSL